MTGLAGLLSVACSTYEPLGRDNDYCTNDDGVPPEEVEVSGRSLLDMVAWIDRTWQERTVTWQGSTQSTLSVRVMFTDETSYIADYCDGAEALAQDMSLTLRLDDDTVFAGPGSVYLVADGYSVSTRLDEDALVETVLAPPFQTLELDSLEVEGAFTDRGPERLVLRDGSGAAFVCDESVVGNCIADSPEPPP